MGARVETTGCRKTTCGCGTISTAGLKPHGFSVGGVSPGCFSRTLFMMIMGDILGEKPPTTASWEGGTGAWLKPPLVRDASSDSTFSTTLKYSELASENPESLSDSGLGWSCLLERDLLVVRAKLSSFLLALMLAVAHAGSCYRYWVHPSERVPLNCFLALSVIHLYFVWFRSVS